MHHVSMPEQKIAFDYEIKIVHRNSKIARISKLEITNENFIEIAKSKNMSTK